MQAKDTLSSSGDLDVAADDLGPLAWVLDELRKSLDGAAKALKRFVREADAAKGSDLATLDASQLRIARQQLHQAVGALEMVGLSGPALVLRAMESAVQKFVQQPEQCSQDAAAKIESASFALTEYLEAVLAGKAISAVSLFPQYRDVQELVRADRIHPADLWPNEWRWLEPTVLFKGEARNYDADARQTFDHSVLQILKGQSTQAAGELSLMSLGFAARQNDHQPRIFWKLTAAYFEALANDLLAFDVYVRRASSRVLLQYASLSRGDVGVSDRLAHDLLFFCAQAKASAPDKTPLLAAVRAAYGLARYKPVDYSAVQFGRFDPALLAQARKRISATKESWSSLSAGDVSKLKTVTDQFSLISDSLIKLHPSSEPLALALTRAIDVTVRSAQPPAIELAMEVATSILYLEAAFEDLDPNDPQLALRTQHLAQRLESVKDGGAAQPLEPWMEELYRSVSDKQTMGSVVGELRLSLGELEKSLDLFFRNSKDKTVLGRVPGQLAQMRGVLSVLGLDQASQAVLRMRDSVEQLLETEIDDERVRSAGTFDQLGNNLGALSFLIDMLNYQPVLAKKLFVYDEAKGELRPLMGRTEKVPGVEQLASASLNPPPAKGGAILFEAPSATDEDLTLKLDTLAMHAELAGQAELAKNAHQASVIASSNDTAATAQALDTLAASFASAPVAPASPPELAEFDEDDLQGIFLDEAREVCSNGAQAITLLKADPSDISQLTILRRVFHTLKGSARMVGLNEFGEAGWALEQLFNGWLADQKAASDDLLKLAGDSLSAFSLWIEDIAASQDTAWSAAPFRFSAEGMRAEGRLVALVLPALAVALPPAVALDLNRPAVDQTSALPQPSNEFVKTVTLTVNDTQLAPNDEPDAALNFEFTTPGALPAASSKSVFFDETFLASQQAPAGAVSEISNIDFDSLAALSGAPDALSSSPKVLAAEPQGMVPIEEPTQEMLDADAALAEMLEIEVLQRQLESFELQASEATLETSQAGLDGDLVNLSADDFDAQFLMPTDAVPSAAYTSSGLISTEEQIKIIGDLRIPIPLYNVYLNEADEWSRRLVAELSEWAMDRKDSMSDSIVFFAHSLAGSSATVGFLSLSEIARALEHALLQSQAHYSAATAAKYADLLVSSAEEIRKLLHQFAAGFLKEADTALISALNALDFTSIELDAEALGEPDIQVAQEPMEARPVALAFDEIGTASSPPDALAPQDSTVSLTPVVATGVAAVVASASAMAFAGATTATAPTVVADVASPTPVPAPTVPVQIVPLYSSALSSASAPMFRAMPAPLSLLQAGNSDDEIDAVDAIDLELFPIFDEEATELMPQLGGALRQWSARPDNLGARMEVLRTLHTLKGSARLAGALRVGEMAHRIESEIEFLGLDAAATQDVESLLTRYDAMQQALDILRFGGAVDVEQTLQTTFAVPSLTQASEPDKTPSVASSASALASVLSLAALAADQPAANMQVAQTPDVVPAVLKEGVSSGKVLIPAPQTMAMQPLRQAATASIRVRSQLLDRMVNQAGEVMITRSRLEVELGQLRGSLGDMTDNLNRLRQQLRDIELQAETQMQSRLAQAKELQAGFDPLEFDRFTRVQELTRMMAESVNDVATVQRTLQRTVEATEDDLIAQARQTRELQRDLLKTRMVEFEGISDRLYRVVRQASKETGKQVKLDLLGGTIEMDRGMLDRMTPAFEHLLRNCVAHGIESPAERSAAGKEPAGLITVHLRQEGNDVSVEFSDDGAGLDLKRIREKAMNSGLLAADQMLDDKQAADLIFMPGFTTAAQVSELAGRGIGMDVVRTEVISVGGRIETSSVSGKGTQFKLILPLTTAVTQVVMIRSGALSVGVPANLVETVRRTAAKDLQQAYNAGTLDVAGEAVPFFWSGALLQSSGQTAEIQGKTTPVVVFRSAAQRVALHVDEVLGNQEVVVKNLGPQLSRLPGLAGMSVLASGAVVLIYNPVALASVYGMQARALSADRAEPHMLEASSGDVVRQVVMAPAVPLIPLVMVVDDSITVRRVTQRLLQREGYRVVLAADGLQALERLQEERPSIVLSDIEMPRMDGFDLARNIRADAKLKDLPIVMITSRIAEKHREYAKELGVDHYLGKPYPEEELMSLVKHYCRNEAMVSA